MKHSKPHSTEYIASLSDSFTALDLAGRIDLVASLSQRTVFTTSLGMEDQVLTWAIAMSGHPFKLVTLQTGRLFPETISLLQITRDRYGIEIDEFHPDPEKLDTYVKDYGKDGFYQSIEARKACCTIRKVVPLAEALSDAEIWITGLRRQQSGERNSVNFMEWDEERRLLKVNPLSDWSTKDVRDAVAAHEIPVNPMHLRGYPSIGCEPCTRAIKPGEPERAGRWWWEQSNSRECGLHVESSSLSKFTDKTPDPNQIKPEAIKAG
ncbi:MAG: phosphoadenylyl-sulfate reductase [Rhizobiaceae bacterium]